LQTEPSGSLHVSDSSTNSGINQTVIIKTKKLATEKIKENPTDPKLNKLKLILDEK